MVDHPRSTPGVGPYQRPRAGLTSLSVQATTGAGTSFALGGGFTSFGVQLTRATPTTLAVSTKASVKLQGSLDGTNWYTIGAATMVANSSVPAAYARSSTVGPVYYARLAINSFTTKAGSAGPDKAFVTGLIAVAP